MASNTSKSFVFILVLLIVLPSAILAQNPGSDTGEEANNYADIASQVEEEARKQKWQFLGAPYVTADSDNGIILGIGTGIAKTPTAAFIINSSVSTTGLAGFTLRGEMGNERTRYILRNALWLFPSNIYPFQGDLPDWEATALLQHTEIQWAALRKITPNFEIGPEIWTDFAKGIEPEDQDGNPLNVNYIPRLIDGSLVLGGIRARYKTTSSVRPIDGVILDLAVRTGRADGVMFKTPRHTTTADFWAAIAKPISPKLRFYARGWFRYQDEAAPSVRNPIGGVFTLRGQPFARDYGRRMVAGRFQLHYKVAEHVKSIGRVAHRIIPFIPEWDLEFEVAPFADIGAVGDPEYGGWHRTRQGYGMSFRLVLPPDLVLFLDLAFTPGGAGSYYFGGGESL